MFERELIAFCIFRWRDSENFTSSDAKNWSVCKRGWDENIDKTIILNIDWMQVADIEERDQAKAVEKAKKKAETENAKKKAKAASSSKAVNEPKGVKSGDETVVVPAGTFYSLKNLLVGTLINGPKLKEDLGVLVGYVMNLKKFLNQAPSGDASAKKLVDNIAASLLTVAADSALGNHNSPNDLSEAVTLHSTQSDVTSILVDESHTLLLEKLSVMETQSVDKVKIVDVTAELLKDALGWVHNPEYDLQEESMKDNFVLVETPMLNSIWNAYHYEGNKAPDWCYNFSGIVRELDEELWVTNLDGREPKSNIIAFF